MILKLRDQNKVLVIKGFPGSFDAAARKRNVDIAPLRALVQRRLCLIHVDMHPLLLSSFYKNAIQM